MAKKGLAKTLGELKATGYTSSTIKEEMRRNLITALQEGKKVFHGIHGFDHTVIPDLERAILSRHSILLLGLRGQAKTKIARLLIRLLDEYIPAVDGSELNDDPLAPVSRVSRDLIAELGDGSSVNQFHHKIGSSLVCCSGIQDF